MSIRSNGARGAGGNRLFGKLQPLGTSIADLLDRLAAIVEGTSPIHDTSDSATLSRLMDLVGAVPATLLGLTLKAANVTPFTGPTIANTAVSNVPGPTDPIYFAGARLLRVTGLGPLVGRMNLFHIVASYNGAPRSGRPPTGARYPNPVTRPIARRPRFRSSSAPPAIDLDQ